jgi:RiboL-PSP-HEPN
MSAARHQFILDIDGLTEAVSLESIAAGATGTGARPGTIILRRGMLVAALIALETFIRDRTVELLARLSMWPASFQDLPQRFRDASILHSLSDLQRYASMLKRQNEDYEMELFSELNLMASSRGPSFGFTKFISGDYTGNISEDSLKDLLAKFQIKDCWNSFRLFSSDIGFGVPSVQEILRDIVRNRHRSAHSSGFSPTASDVTSLAANLICLGICFDCAMTTSVEQSVAKWRDWSDGKTSWRNDLNIYFADPVQLKYRLKKLGGTRALRIVDDERQAAAFIPRPQPGHSTVLVTRDTSLRPIKWLI